PRRLAPLEVRVRLVGVFRLFLDACVVPQRRLVDWVPAPVGVVDGLVPRADRQHDAPAACAHDHVVRVRRAMQKVPGFHRTLLALDDRERLAGQDEEVLLVGLPVIHRHRLAWPEHLDIDPELVEVGRLVEAFEPRERAASPALEPERLARVDDEPALVRRQEAPLGLRQLGPGPYKSSKYVAAASPAPPTPLPR